MVLPRVTVEVPATALLKMAPPAALAELLQKVVLKRSTVVGPLPEEPLVKMAPPSKEELPLKVLLLTLRAALPLLPLLRMAPPAVLAPIVALPLSVLDTISTYTVPW
jgi:hypothetical protein